MAFSVLCHVFVMFYGKGQIGRCNDLIGLYDEGVFCMYISSLDEEGPRCIGWDGELWVKRLVVGQKMSSEGGGGRRLLGTVGKKYMDNAPPKLLFHCTVQGLRDRE